MQFTQYTDVHAFYYATGDILMRHEAQNVIPLGNIIIGVEGRDKTDWRDPVNWFMATVSDYNGIKLTAIMTPPHNIAIYATDNQNSPEAIHCLIEGIANADVPTPGVLAEKSLAEMFASIYNARHNKASKISMSQRIYELTEVNPQIPKVSLRLATERDMAFLPYWDAGFRFDGKLSQSFTLAEDMDYYRHIIRSRRTYIMEDGGVPVSVARISRDLKNVCVVSYVYTPPYFRKRGYATACTAAVSQMGLNRGFKKCVLYTDLTNPTSNSIYQKIGYRPICDSLEIKFE